MTADREINEKRIRVSQGLVNIPQFIDLDLGDEVMILLDGEVVKIEETDNQDGSKNVTYVVKCTEIKNVNGQEID
jgi:hypothetical protein